MFEVIHYDRSKRLISLSQAAYLDKIANQFNIDASISSRHLCSAIARWKLKLSID